MAAERRRRYRTDIEDLKDKIRQHEKELMDMACEAAVPGLGCLQRVELQFIADISVAVAGSQLAEVVRRICTRSGTTAAGTMSASLGG